MSERFINSKPFTREQLIFLSEVILCSALDRIESGLPTCIDWGDREWLANKIDKIPHELMSYDRGALEAAGMALAVLYAQTTGDGMGIGDALGCADKFDEACAKLVYDSWIDKGKAVKEKDKTGKQIHDILPSWPEVRNHAIVFVDNAFSFKKNGEVKRSPDAVTRPSRPKSLNLSHDELVVMLKDVGVTEDEVEKATIIEGSVGLEDLATEKLGECDYDETCESFHLKRN